MEVGILEKSRRVRIARISLGMLESPELHFEAFVWSLPLWGHAGCVRRWRAALQLSGFASDCACLASPPSMRSSLCGSEEHTSELQSRQYLVCRLLLEK